MAGIKLTDMEQSHPDMSGAMPAATVEEINVPVFIDEYIPESLEPTLPDTTATAIINNCDDEYGNGNCLENETFEPFDFDIDMIAEKIDEFYDKSSEDDSNNMFNYNEFNIMPNSNCDDIKLNKSNINNSMFDINEENFDSEMIFRDRNCITLDDILGDDNSDSDLTAFTKDAVDINKQDEWHFTQAFTNMQNNPTLAETICASVHNSQEFLANAEPVVPDFQSDIEFEDCYQSNNQLHSNSQQIYNEAYNNDCEIDIKENINTNNSQVNGNANVLKRCTSPIETVMPKTAKKRLKLRLDTSQNSNGQDHDLQTPDIIELVSAMDRDGLKLETEDSIFKGLFESMSSYQARSEPADTTTNSDGCLDDDSPYTPHSCTSSHTNQTFHTEYYTSSPTSPAFSVTSTTPSINSASRKKRGRPSKAHSDLPNPEQLIKLTEPERKLLMARAKNNEASRLSRRKNKDREDAEIAEEQQLMEVNAKLKIRLALLEEQHAKLKKALFKNIIT